MPEVVIWIVGSGFFDVDPDRPTRAAHVWIGRIVAHLTVEREVVRGEDDCGGAERPRDRVGVHERGGGTAIWGDGDARAGQHHGHFSCGVVDQAPEVIEVGCGKLAGGHAGDVSSVGGRERDARDLAGERAVAQDSRDDARDGWLWGVLLGSQISWLVAIRKGDGEDACASLRGAFVSSEADFGHPFSGGKARLGEGLLDRDCPKRVGTVIRCCDACERHVAS